MNALQREVWQANLDRVDGQYQARSKYCRQHGINRATDKQLQKLKDQSEHWLKMLTLQYYREQQG